MFIRKRIAVLLALSPLMGHAGQNYQVYVSNEKSGDVTIINGSDNRVLGTIFVGKRPRGIHGSPDGKTVYVALSGTPIAAPLQLDAKGTRCSKEPRTTMTTIVSRPINRLIRSPSSMLRRGK